MCVYIIRAGFDFVIVFSAPAWGLFVTKILQDIFYMVWDLPIVLPPLVMHYLNYRPQYKEVKKNQEDDADRDRDTIIEDGYVGQERGSYAQRPLWLKELASVESINRDHADEIFDSLCLNNGAVYQAEARKTVSFEITNDVYEYSGLLRRMIESSRNSISQASTEDTTG
jgi:hypothetical protein